MAIVEHCHSQIKTSLCHQIYYIKMVFFVSIKLSMFELDSYNDAFFVRSLMNHEFEKTV
jgi:hypothetical protein